MKAVVIGLIAGILFAFFCPVHIPPAYTKYVALGILAALDSLVKGVLEYFKGRFKLKIFVSGFLVNSLLASGLTFMGNKLGVDISLAAIITFGTRLFQNFAIFRRYLLNKSKKRDIIE
ncbi:MAG: small basic family protein [Oscillospiraceae bacterium]|nr:small basic family protein [Oscillospiraceae bacterium]